MLSFIRSGKLAMNKDLIKLGRTTPQQTQKLISHPERLSATGDSPRITIVRQVPRRPPLRRRENV